MLSKSANLQYLVSSWFFHLRLVVRRMIMFLVPQWRSSLSNNWFVADLFSLGTGIPLGLFLAGLGWGWAWLIVLACHLGYSYFSFREHKRRHNPINMFIGGLAWIIATTIVARFLWLWIQTPK